MKFRRTDATEVIFKIVAKKHVASSGMDAKKNVKTNKTYLKSPSGDEAKQQKQTENTYKYRILPVFSNEGSSIFLVYARESTVFALRVENEELSPCWI